MKLVEIKEISGTITLKTGLHIGAGDIEMHIGGTDNPVIKHPFTHEPYIPGSSLKGKVRSLLELKSGLMGLTNGDPISLKIVNSLSDVEQKKEALKIIKLFGTSASESDGLAKEPIGPARVSFSDCELDEEIREKIKEGKMVYSEIKAENSINRITSTAKNPRFTERVPAGIKFRFLITLKKFQEDKDDLEDLLLTGLKLLEFDALGGNGSRGYGRVKFKFDDDELNKKFKNILPFKKGD